MPSMLALLLIAPIANTPLDGETLLDRMIAHHDPNGDWMRSAYDFEVRGEYADGRTNLRRSRIDYRTGDYHGRNRSDGHEIDMRIEGDKCALRVNGRPDFSTELAKKLRVSCDRARLLRNYMSYLWGLPMKLKDPGTIIDPRVRRGTFEGRPALILTVRYAPEVGTDVWSFYADPKTYALIGYGFEKADGKGEYITLNGTYRLASGARVPASRSWYMTKDRRYLGKDVLVSARRVEQQTRSIEKK